MAFLIIILAVISLIPVCVFATNAERIIYNKYFIEKNDIGGDEKKVKLKAQIEQEEKEITLNIPAKVYSENELAQKVKEAEQYIEQSYLGNNKSSDNVVEDLNFISDIPDNAINIKWQTDVEGYISSNGKLNKDKLNERKQIEISVILSYNEFEKKIVYELTVCPAPKSVSETIWDKWQEACNILIDKTAQQKYMQLPTDVSGHEVSYYDEENNTFIYILLCGILCIVLVPFILESRMKEAIQKREKELKKAYPEFIEKFILLIGAGLNVKGAWLRITDEYKIKKEKENKKSYLYEEMLVTRYQIENGMTEIKAYELFGRRIGLLPYMKFSTLLTQNLKKGTSDMLKTLEYEAVDVLNEKKENAKILGEEAGTKLLMPMMIMMVEVFVIILYAAFQSM